jgi:thiosulfate/3-mercaptopyruvate sulfurtransferase
VNVHHSRLVRTAALLALLCAAFGTAYARQAGSATAIPEAQFVQPEKLAQILGSTDGARPLIFQVGPHVMFAEAHPPGAEYIGAGALDSGIQALRERVKALPHDQTIVLYCGCCPWIKCPNVAPAYQQLASLGFRNVKVLFIATNFGADWVSKGYPVEKGR